jgi:hypothetical protein
MPRKPFTDILADAIAYARGDRSRGFERSRALLLAYADVLADGQQKPRDIGDLPASKDELKLALREALIIAVAQGDQEMVSLTSTAYLRLADFQPGVNGADTIEKAVRDGAEQTKVIGADENAIMRAALTRIAAIPKQPDWSRICTDEMLTLRAELDSFVKSVRPQSPSPAQPPTG